MKKIYVLLLTIVSLFAFNAQALRISHYESTFDMDQEIVDDKVSFELGYLGEDAYKTSLVIEYDSDMLEFDTVSPSDGFDANVEIKTISTISKKLILDFTSSYITNNVKYGKVSFKIKKDFKVGNTTQLKFYDIISILDENNKYRCKGYFLELKRETKDTVSGIRNDITEETERKNYIDSILPYVVIGIGALFILMFVIILLPSAKHENRSKKIKAQMSSKYYNNKVKPIPELNHPDADLSIQNQFGVNPFEGNQSKAVVNNEAIASNSPFSAEQSNQPAPQEAPAQPNQDELINIKPVAFNNETDDDIETLK